MNNYLIISKEPSIIWMDNTDVDDRMDASFFNVNYIENRSKMDKSDTNYLTMAEICSRIKCGPFGSAILASQYTDYGIPFLRPLNLKEDIANIDDDVVFISEEDCTRLKSTIFNSGSLLFTQRGNGVGDVAILPNKLSVCNISANLIGAIINENYDNYYVLTFLRCLYGQKQLEQSIMNSVKPKLDTQTIKSLSIPVPSPEIQKHIGDKVRKAEELREEAKRLKKEAEKILYKELKEEEFLEKQKTIINKFIWLNNKDIETRIDSEYYKPKYILYKHILKENGISTLQIKDIVKDIKTGTTPESKFITQEKQRFKFLKVNNLDYCFLNEDDLLYIDNNYEEKKLRFLQQEDILVSIAGTLGKSAVIDTNNCTTNQNIASLTLKNVSDIRPYYLSMYFNSYFGNLALDTISTQATVKYINNELLGDIEIPIVKIDIQILIENKVIEHKNKFNNSKQLIKEAKQDIEDLIEGNFDMSKIKENN